MEITLNQVSKRFNFNWIFKNVSLQIHPDEPWVIQGSNGSGKSTLLSLIAASALPSDGEIRWKLHGNLIPDELVYRHVSMAAPYLELIEEFTLQEHIDFHFSVKPAIHGLSNKEIIQLSGLARASDRRVSYFSSGMKQRLKLTLAILSDTSLLLLDEPLSNLDRQAGDWYRDLMTTYSLGRTVVVCSNHDERESFFCRKSLSISDFHA